MNKESAYMLDKLVKIVAVDKYETNWFKYVKSKRILGYMTHSYIRELMGERMSIEAFKEFHKDTYFIEDCTVYEYPEVIMIFAGDIKKRKLFKTYKEAVNYKSYILTECGTYIDDDGDIDAIT